MKNNTSITALVILMLVSFNIKWSVAQIPDGAFPIIYTGHLYLKGSIDGNEGNYVFDTGATNLYIDDLHYAKGDYKFENTFLGLLPGIGSKPQRVKVIMDTVSFKFQNNIYKTVKVPVLQLKPILGDIADGIMGNEYFKNSVLEINYEQEYMSIHPTIDALDLKPYDRINMVKRDNRFFLPLHVVINDSTTIAGDYILDLGSGGTVSLTSLVAESQNLGGVIKNKVAYFTKYGGIGGESSSYDFSARYVTIGNFMFKNVLMDYSLDVKGALASNKYLGILGNKILERFNIVIDFKNHDLYLKPNTSYEKAFEPTVLGFSFVDRAETLNAWIVTGIYKNSNADLSGLKIDDEILLVNEIDVSTLNYNKRKSFFNKLDEVRLKVKRANKELDITIALEPILKIEKESVKN